ncbi:permease [Microcystis sp.]|uniref:permease n=1 Tax=Microcystis sp. TaxID=1127 RepID=UPI00391A88A6
MNQISIAVTFFLSLVLTSLPFLLLGTAVSSFLLVFVNKQRLAAIFPRNRLLGAIVGSTIGLILPVGQYGTIPVARRFLLEGVPPGVVFSFLTAAPTLNIVTLWLTWQTFSYSSIFFYRSLSVWLMAIFIGTLFSFYREKPRTDSEIPLESSLVLSGSFLPEEAASQPLQRVGSLVYEYKARDRQAWPISVQLFLDNFIDEALELGGLLIIGCAIASVFQLLLPQSQLIAWGNTPATQILVQLFFGFTLAVNASLSTFVPGSLITNLSVGSTLAFLLVASLIDIKAFILLLSAFRPKIVLYFGILCLLMTFLVALILSFYLG